MEAKAFNDRYDRFRDAGYEVIGVSIDHSETNDEFRAECDLDFPLVSDEDGDADDRDRRCSRTTATTARSRGASRSCSTPTASSTKVWDVTDAGAHPDEVLAAVSGA